MLIIQRSQIAGFSSSGALAPCPKRPYIPSCAEHGAGVGRSSTGRPYGAARKSRSGKSVGAVDETATDSATFFGPPHALVLGAPAAKPPTPRGGSRPPRAAGGAAPLPTRLRSPRDAVSSAPSASAEHRPGRDRPDLGGRPGDVHLLRAPGSRSERRDRDRDRAGLVRRNLAPRAAPRRGHAAPPPHQPPALLALRGSAAGIVRCEREDELARELVAELSVKALAGLHSLRVEALQMCCE